MAWLRDISLNKQKHVYQGIVRTGRGGAAAEMSKPDFLDSLNTIIELRVIPGTLNIKLLEPIDLLLLRYLKFTDVGWEFDPAKQGIKYKGEIGVYYRRITVAKKYTACLMIWTWATNIHTDAELVSPYELHKVLNLKDGNNVNFTLDKG
jgi:CTP-dependent riboflavin kinase